MRSCRPINLIDGWRISATSHRMEYLMLAGAFLIVTFLELVLVVDNALVIILMCKGLPEEKRAKAERLGILQGALLRVVLIFFIGWITKLSVPIPVLSDFMQGITGHEFTITSAINFVGGGVLLAMAAYHIRKEWKPAHKEKAKKFSSIGAVLVQTFGISLIFSIDSVMSAVGTVDNLWVAGSAVFVAATVMIFAVDIVSDTLSRYPDLKSLGLAFVLMIGGFLVAEGLGYHVPKAIIYCSLGFALLVQIIDILRDRAEEREEERKEKRLGQMKLKEMREANSEA